MQGRLYLFGTVRRQSLEDCVKEAVAEFKVKHECDPMYILMRTDEHMELTNVCGLRIMRESILSPNNFMLILKD